MKRVTALFIFIGLLAVLGKAAYAQQIPHPEHAVSRGTIVNATVGKYRLTISGFQSPNASIILKTQNGVFLASTTADEKGYFTFTDLLINSSETVYCFQAVDFRRVGVSESCITIPSETNKDILYENVFLPPTIGLSKEQIYAGESAVIYGYSMPKAIVSINIAGKVITVTADDKGYYAFTYQDVPEGIFKITATATLDEEESLTPTNEAVLEVKPVIAKITDQIPRPSPTATREAFNILPYLLVALALLVAIGILLYKLRLRWWVYVIDFLRRKQKMHHDWFLNRW